MPKNEDFDVWRVLFLRVFELGIQETLTVLTESPVSYGTRLLYSPMYSLAILTVSMHIVLLKKYRSTIT